MRSSSEFRVHDLIRHDRACPGHPRLSCFAVAKTWMPGTRPGMTENGSTEALLDHDLAGHAEFGVGLAIAGLDVAAQVAGAAGRDRHQPPFGGLSWIDLDLADRALEFRK